MKNRLEVPKNRPLADFLPAITIKAKDFANEITIFNVKKDSLLQGEQQISVEHIKNNKDVRGLLIKRGIRPEELPPEEDVKKLKRRVVEHYSFLEKPEASDYQGNKKSLP